MKNTFKILISTLFFFVASTAGAQSPLGLWKTIDDSTKEVKAIVEISEKEGKLFGKIIKTFPKPDAKTTCDNCPGDLKDQPIVGLQIIIDMEKNDDIWDGGKILDPENGTWYKAKMEVQDSGKKLKVRGYIGFSLLGRTQYWEREITP